LTGIDPSLQRTADQTIGRYRIVRKLGSGEMGDVYEAAGEDGARVALKVLRFSGYDKTEVHRRFVREAKLSASVRHPNVVRVIDHGFEGNVPFLVMPLLTGATLQSKLDETGPLSPAVAVSLVLEAAHGLAAAHAKGIIHRDFKPANVILQEVEDAVVPIVGDFGIAKVYDDDGSLTASGSVLGTPLYMAPEQFIDCKRVDARCDVWALGMVLYHALAGRAALADVTGIGELLVALREVRVPPVQSFAPWVDPSLARVVHAALLPVDRRFASVNELIAALERCGTPRVPLTRASVVGISAEEKAVKAALAQSVRSAADLAMPHDPTVPDRPSKTSGSYDDLVGTMLGDRYLLGAKLGAGGMGVVYDAVDLTIPQGNAGRSVAVKVMLLDVGARSSDASKRFLREARSAQKVKGPHAVAVLDVGVDASIGAHYLVMERLHGRDLGAVIQETSALAPEVAVGLVVQACEGLAAAHAMGIVHRDVKPSNLFVHEDDGKLVVKVCDFGIAKQLATELQGVDSADMTQTGGILGSPLYMSPEQARSAKTVDARTDVFSLALTLHEALSGLRPWAERSNMAEIIVAVVTEDVPSLADVAPWVDPRLAAVVKKALAREVALRTPSIAAFAEALRPFALDRPLVPSDLAPVPAERRGKAPAPPAVERSPASSTTDGAELSARARTADPVAISQSPSRPARRGVLLGIGGVAIAAALGVVLWAKRTPPASEVASTPAPTSSVVPEDDAAAPSAAPAPVASASAAVDTPAPSAAAATSAPKVTRPTRPVAPPVGPSARAAAAKPSATEPPAPPAASPAPVDIFGRRR
jgi:serine/threonine protein kinase